MYLQCICIYTGMTIMPKNTQVLHRSIRHYSTVQFLTIINTSKSLFKLVTNVCLDRMHLLSDGKYSVQKMCPTTVSIFLSIIIILLYCIVKTVHHVFQYTVRVYFFYRVMPSLQGAARYCMIIHVQVDGC